MVEKQAARAEFEEARTERKAGPWRFRCESNHSYEKSPFSTGKSGRVPWPYPLILEYQRDPEGHRYEVRMTPPKSECMTTRQRCNMM